MRSVKEIIPAAFSESSLIPFPKEDELNVSEQQGKYILASNLINLKKVALKITSKPP